jgi:hypothetical protein
MSRVNTRAALMGGTEKAVMERTGMGEEERMASLREVVVEQEKMIAGICNTNAGLKQKMERTMGMHDDVEETIAFLEGKLSKKRKERYRCDKVNNLVDLCPQLYW